MGRLPKTKIEYWGPKIARNVARDADQEQLLLAAGWKVLTVWQCELRDVATLESKLKSALG